MAAQTRWLESTAIGLGDDDPCDLSVQDLFAATDARNTVELVYGAESQEHAPTAWGPNTLESSFFRIQSNTIEPTKFQELCLFLLAKSSHEAVAII